MKEINIRPFFESSKLIKFLHIRMNLSGPAPRHFAFFAVFVAFPCAIAGNDLQVRQMNTSTQNPVRGELIRHIFGSLRMDPFATFKPPVGIHMRRSPHTHISAALTTHLLGITKAKLVVEVGAFIGGSSILLARALDGRRQSEGEFGTLVSIDPFVGDVSVFIVKLLVTILCVPSTYSTNNNIFVNEYEYIVEVQRRLENTCMLLHFFNSIYVLLEIFFESFYVSDSVFSGFSNVSYCSQFSTCTSV